MPVERIAEEYLPDDLLEGHDESCYIHPPITQTHKDRVRLCAYEKERQQARERNRCGTFAIKMSTY